jgi:DNA sulfur modification protein DndE
MNYAPVETVRVSELGKRQLTTLKRRTGIRNWNVICRWAVCVSLGELSRPPIIDKGDWSNVEMSWSTFGGPHADIYSAVFMARCSADGLDTDPDTLAEQFRLHLHRGLTHLVGLEETRSLPGLLSLALN